MEFSRSSALASFAFLFAVALPTLAPAQLGDLGKLAKQPEKKDGTMQVTVKLPPYYGPKKRLAVQDMEIKVQASTTSDPTSSGGVTTTTTVYVSPPTDFGQGLTEMLTTALSQTGRFILVERSTAGLQDIQKEQSQAGVSPETQAQANKLLGAQMLVRGAVTEYSYRKTSTGGSADFLRGIGVATGSASASVTLDIKLYDATTGEIYDSEKAEGTARASATALNVDKPDLKFGGSTFVNSPLGEATRHAIEKAVTYICKKMDEQPWEGRVAEVADEGNGAELYLNCGKRAGIKVGDEFEVFTPGKVIMDPDTPGRILSKTKGRRIGHCRVKSVEDDISIATPTEGEGFEAKDTIRFAQPVKAGG